MYLRDKLIILILASGLLFSFVGCSGPSDSSSGGDDQNMGMNDDQNNNDDDMGGDSSEEKAPDFTYTALGGGEYTLSDLQGNVVYLFFFGAGCPHCRSNGPATEDKIYQPYRNNENFVALGLDTWNESASDVEEFKEVTGISYPLLLNAEQSLIDYYGNTTSYDRSVVVDADGNIAYQGTEYVNEDADEVADIIQEELDKVQGN